MSCNTCKSKKEKNLNPETETVGNNYLGKVIVFLLSGVILTPFIIPIFLVVLFKVIVLGHGVDITPLLKYLGRKIFKKDEEESETENEELNEDDYELENPNDIIEFKSK